MRGYFSLPQKKGFITIKVMNNSLRLNFENFFYVLDLYLQFIENLCRKYLIKNLYKIPNVFRKNEKYFFLKICLLKMFW